MRAAVWLVVVVVVGAIAWADPATGTVVISCNETDASLLVDGVLIPERTPAVLTLPVGTHLIEVRKPSLLAQKQTVEVREQQQIKLRFELVAHAPAPPPAPDAGVGSGSGSGSGQLTAAGSGAAAGSAAAAQPAPPAPPATPVVNKPESHCREGGHDVPCSTGSHCTQGGKPVSCVTGKPLEPAPTPPTAPAPPVAVGTAAGSAAGSPTPAEPPPSSSTAAIEIATTAPHAVAYVDGAPVRDAPCVLELEPGEHVVAVYTEGMVPAEAIVHAELGRRQRVELTPAKPRQRINVPAR